MNLPFKKILKPALVLSIALLSNTAAMAQTAATTAADQDFSFSVNDVLAFCAALLLIVIMVLGFTLRSSILYYHQRRKQQSNNNSGTKVLSLIILAMLFISYPSFAQDAASASTENVGISESELVRYLLIVFIAIEMFVVFQFAKMIRFFTGVESFNAEHKVAKKASFSLTKIWERMNKLRPIEEEASLDTGHSYDGIRELNNVTPPWFIAGFALSILFAIVYLWRYHVSESAPLQIEEYNTSVVEAKIKLDEYLKTQANNVDENTVVMLDASGITAGQALYTSNCVACHGDKAQGAAVGPNLTDNYWLHQGGITDVFKSIKYGWPEKGMKSWKEDFSATQIAQLSSYILSLKGSKIEGAKEPQGELYEATPQKANDSNQTTMVADTLQKAS